MLLNISPHSELTLQDQIVGQIRARILRGELEPDEALTSIRALSQILKVGVNTVQRAYDQLLKEALIYARPGKGFLRRSSQCERKVDAGSPALFGCPARAHGGRHAGGAGPQ